MRPFPISPRAARHGRASCSSRPAARRSRRASRSASRAERILFVCGRYEGHGRARVRHGRRAPLHRRLRPHRRRAARHGGERRDCPAAPGALGNDMGSVDESFSTAEDGGLLEYEQYTRPAQFNGSSVPDVLLSGDHAKVDAWRRANAIERTCRWRPDLIADARLSDEGARERRRSSRASMMPMGVVAHDAVRESFSSLAEWGGCLPDRVCGLRARAGVHRGAVHGPDGLDGAHHPGG